MVGNIDILLSRESAAAAAAAAAVDGDGEATRPSDGERAAGQQQQRRRRKRAPASFAHQAAAIRRRRLGFPNLNSPLYWLLSSYSTFMFMVVVIMVVQDTTVFSLYRARSTHFLWIRLAAAICRASSSFCRLAGQYRHSQKALARVRTNRKAFRRRMLSFFKSTSPSNGDACTTGLTRTPPSLILCITCCCSCMFKYSSVSTLLAELV